MSNKQKDANCKVLGTDADKADHVIQQSPTDTDRKAISEYSEWEKSRPGKATR